MSTSFYGGSTVFDGRVRRLNATTFKELVNQYIRIPIQAPYTRQEFFAMPEKERNRRKDSAFIVSCSYDFEEGHREDDTAVSLNMVVLDLDAGPFIKDFDQSPETIGEHLYPFAYTVWRTASYRPEAPRLKIAVPVNPCHPKHHRRFVRFIADRLGLPHDFKGSRESGVLSQPQYRPCQFKGEPFNAVIGMRLDGAAIHEADLPEMDEETTEVIEGRIYACDRWDEDDLLGLAYLPVAGLTVEDIRDALYAIDPDTTYEHWIWCASAMRAQFLEEDEAEEAFQLFDEWSSTGSKYPGSRGSGGTFSKWRSVRPYAKGRAPITIRTLFRLALDTGKWDGHKIATKVKESVLEWLSGCTDEDLLMQEGAKRIVAMPFRNDVVEESLIAEWRERIKAVTGKYIDKATLKKEVARTRKKEIAAKQDSKESLLPGWLMPITFIATDDTFHDGSSGVALKPPAFDRKFEKELMPKEDVPANGKPIMSPSAYALNIMKIQRVDRKIYCPLHQGEDPFFELDGHLYLNTYDRNTIPVEDPEFMERAGELFVQHNTHLVGNDYLDVILDFYAALVQHPGRKVRWAPAIQSAEGVGKGFLGEILTCVLGIGNVKSHDPTTIREKWTDWMLNAQLHILDEIHFPGERREAIMNSLKKFVADLKIPINQRHTDARVEPNWACVLAFTNYKDALHLKDSDRRWMPICSPLQTKKHVLELNASGHFQRMDWLKTSDGAGGLRYWLRKRKIAADFPFDGPAPLTRFRDAVIEESKNPLQLRIEDLIEDSVDPLVGREVIHAGRLGELVARNHGESCRLGHYLGLMGYEKYGGSDRPMIDGVRGPLYVHTERWLNGMPPLEFLKKRMEENELGLL